jgi:hypothetical protein
MRRLLFLAPLSICRPALMASWHMAHHLVMDAPQIAPIFQPVSSPKMKGPIRSPSARFDFDDDPAEGRVSSLHESVSNLRVRGDLAGKPHFRRIASHPEDSNPISKPSLSSR